MKLYCFGESGNAYKAALTLELAELEWQAEWVDFFGGATRSPEFRAINPMGEVPVLQDQGNVITQSAVIQIYIAEMTGRFLGVNEDERREVLRWLFWDNHKLSGLAGSTRFLMNFLPEDKRPDAVITFQQARLGASYKVLDQHLDAHDWIVGTTPSLADFACCGYLFYPEPFGFVRSEWPAIDRWLTRIADLPGWKHPYELMPGSPADRT